jgi:mRNA-degrading endonuclease toxin of MazEF toxin-antitoxin module
MARGDILLVALPESDKREEKGTRPAIAVQADDEQSPMLMIIPPSERKKELVQQLQFKRMMSNHQC